MIELRVLSPTRTPPAGGLSRLQRAVAAQGTGLQPRWRWLAMAASLVLLVMALPLWMAPSRDDGSLDRALHDALLPPPSGNAVLVHDGAALAVDSGRQDVRIYLIQRLPPRPVPSQ